MRLAVIASLLPADSRGGAEAYVDAIVRALSERHDVTIFTGSETGTVDGIPIVRLPHLPRLAPDAPAAGKILWHALDQWLPPVHVAVKRELERLAPDVVLTHQPQGLSAAVYTAVATSPAAHVHTAHDLNMLCARVTMTRGGEFCGGRCLSCRVQRTIRSGTARLNLDRLIGVSRYISERHVRAGVVPPERAETIRLGAQPGRSRLRKLNHRGLTLGFIGSLGTHKGILTLLDAFAQVDASWRLVIAGSGSHEPEVVRAARRDARIQYVGYVHGASKDEFFDELDLLVIPSEWEEPSTFAAVEGAVRGIPAVVSERGGLPETPEARTFRAGDARELIRALDFFAAPGRLEHASAALLAKRDDYEWRTHVRRVEQLLEQVVRERGLPPGRPRARGAA